MNSKQVNKPPRVQRAEMAEFLQQSIPVAKTYQMYPTSDASEGPYQALRNTVKRLKGFLWFLTKLDWSQFLHYMNDACTYIKLTDEKQLDNPLQDEPTNTVENYSEVVLENASPSKKVTRRENRTKSNQV